MELILRQSLQIKYFLIQFKNFFKIIKKLVTQTTCKNGPEDVNHAVLAVGYGTDHDGKEFWTVKNSWSTDWGNHGYFDIERGVNMCGLAQCTSFALIQP